MGKRVTSFKIVVATILRKARFNTTEGSKAFDTKLIAEVNKRLEKSEFYIDALHGEFFKQGINLIAVIGRTLNADFPWSGVGTEYMPAYPGVLIPACQTPQNSDNEDPIEEFNQLDLLFSRALAISTDNSESDSDTSNAKSDIFAAVLSSKYSFPYLCSSSLMRDFAGHWIKHLAAGPASEAVASTSLLYRRFQEITLQKPVASLLTAMCDGFLYYAKILAKIKIEATTLSKFSNDWDSIKRSAKIIALSNEDRIALSKFANQSGNNARFWSTIDSLFEHPEIFARTLRECALRDDEMFDAVSYCMASWVRDIANDYPGETAVKEHVDAHRRCLMNEGFSDIQRSKALDPLAMHLELGEFFYLAEYLRQEEMDIESTFATYFVNKYTNSSLFTDPSMEDFLCRRVDLAVGLGQKKLLLQSADQFFSGHHPTNRAFSNDVSVARLLTHSLFKPSEILRTKLRVDKAIEWGLGSIITKDPSLKKYMGKAFTSDLGI